MATLVDQQGNRSVDTMSGPTNGTAQRPGKVVLPCSDGSLIMVIVDRNGAAAAVGYGDQSNVPKIEVWRTGAGRNNWTRVANITPTDGIKAPFIYAADLFSDNSIGIIWVSDSGIRYRKVTTGTWAVGAEQTVGTKPSNGDFQAIDVSVSDSGSVLAVAAIAYTSGTVRQQFRMYCQRFGQTGWVNFGNQDISTVAERGGGTAVAVSWGRGTLLSGRRTYMVVYGAVNTSSDLGFSGWMDSMDETATPASTTRVQAFSGVSAGSLAKEGGWGQHVRTCQIAPTNENHTFLFGGASVQTKVRVFAGKMSFNGNAVTEVLPIEASGNLPGRAVTGISTVAVTVGADSINFLSNIREPNTPGVRETMMTQPKNWVAAMKKDGTGFLILGPNYFNGRGQPGRDTFLLFGGGGRNARASRKHDMAYSKGANASGPQNGTLLYHQYAVAPLQPPRHSPMGGATVSSSTPPVSVGADLDRYWPQAHLKGVWQFAKDATFTTNLRAFTQEDDKYVQVMGTNRAGAMVQLTDVLPPLYELAQGQWYVRTALVDAFGQQSNFNISTFPFTVSHPPTVTEMQPAGDQMIAYTAGQVQFAWKFSDSSETDYQTAFQVIVRDNDTDAIVYDSEKVTSENESHVATLPSSAKEKVLAWTVTVWDKDDVAGVESVPQTFFLADAPVVDISIPTSGQVLTTGVPSVTFAATTSGGRKMTRYKVVWTKNGQVVHSSGDVILSNPISSGVDVTYRPADPILKNLSGYSVQVFVTDEYGLEGVSPLVPVSTNFVVPAGPVGVMASSTQYNLETGGYVLLTWSDTGRDVDFQAWVVYRRADVLDPYTGLVIQEGEYQIAGYVYETAASYMFRDYYAPSGHQCSYIVRQLVNRYGDVVESANDTPVTAMPSSEGYWLIQHDDETGETRDVVRLHNVVSDEYTREIEEAEYTVMGRGRHVDRGDVLGVKGSLTAQIRDSAGKSARQRKLELEQIQEENTSLYIRTPFGDVFSVYVGSLSISRIAGVGTSEFVDVTIPYAEVYE